MKRERPIPTFLPLGLERFRREGSYGQRRKREVESFRFLHSLAGAQVGDKLTYQEASLMLARRHAERRVRFLRKYREAFVDAQSQPLRTPDASGSPGLVD